MATLELAYIYQAQAQEIGELRDNIADLEDKSRRIINFRVIPEEIPNTELITYPQQFYETILPLSSPQKLIVDGAHRIVKPEHVPPAVPQT